MIPDTHLALWNVPWILYILSSIYLTVTYPRIFSNVRMTLLLLSYRAMIESQ